MPKQLYLERMGLGIATINTATLTAQQRLQHKEMIAFIEYGLGLVTQRTALCSTQHRAQHIKVHIKASHTAAPKS